MSILIIQRFFKWGGLILGPILWYVASITTSPVPAGILLLLGLLLLLISALLIHQFFRKNTSQIVKELEIETWPAVSDGSHNSNTDLVFWKGAFYLIHASSPFHLASTKCRLIIRRSEDAREWEEIAVLTGTARDIRDPKFLPLGDTLFLYVMLNETLNPEPFTSMFTSSRDGKKWESLRSTGHEGWLFWRPKSRDGKTWYLPAYWWEHGKSALFRTKDGISWDYVSEIYSGGRNDETAIEFLKNGDMIMTARLEYSENIFGDTRGCTQISTASHPYDTWRECTKSYVTRLDGPALFPYHGRVFAVGRYQPKTQGFIKRQGSAFTIKRTALFEVTKKGLIYLSDLPSAGDTSYAGFVIRDNTLYTCYYTSRIDRDYIWIEGMLGPSEIRVAKIDLTKLEALANEKSQTGRDSEKT